MEHGSSFPDNCSFWDIFPQFPQELINRAKDCSVRFSVGTPLNLRSCTCTFQARTPLCLRSHVLASLTQKGCPIPR